MATWIIRGGSSRGLHEDEFLESGTIGIYFGADLDLEGMDDDAIHRSIHEFYLLALEEQGRSVSPSSIKRTVTRFFNQVLLFRDVVQPGDTVLMPRKRTGGHMVAIGTVIGDYEHWENAIYQHRRPVRWLEDSVPKERTGCNWGASDQSTIIKVGE